MKTTIITLSFAAQLVAFGAFAQTSGTSAETSSGTFGSDWSMSLGSAMFAEGGTSVRPAAELSTQWATLSDEDKAMLQRDCMASMQQSGGTAESTATTGAAASGGLSDTTTTTGAAAGGTSDTTATDGAAAGGTSDTTAGAATGAAGTAGGSTTTGAASDTTAATGTAGTTAGGTTGTGATATTGTTGATAGSTAGTGTDMTSAGATSPMNVTMEQMEEICAATKDM